MKYRTVSLILKVTSAEAYKTLLQNIPLGIEITSIDVDPLEYEDIVILNKKTVVLEGDESNGKTVEK